MPAYLCKLATKGREIILIDAFAGPGVYENEETGPYSKGSPIIMCEQAEKHVRGKYQAYFGNVNRQHHKRLAAELQETHISPDVAHSTLLSSNDLLAEVAGTLTSQTVFLYLDPFGYKGCEFSSLRPFFLRPSFFSTEIMVNLNVADLPRLAARQSIQDGEMTEQVAATHRLLTDVLNGDWWKEILLGRVRRQDEQAEEIIKGYVSQFAGSFRFTGYCPVPDMKGGRIKYYITFFSNHPDALVLHNDNMCKAYNEHIVKVRWDGSMFADQRTWKDDIPRDYDLLDHMIFSKLEKLNQGRFKTSKEQLWLAIITEPGCFMKWTKSEYNTRIKGLVGDYLVFEDVTKTGRLNDKARLYARGTA
jgi:three-Cys-motif partner protein